MCCSKFLPKWGQVLVGCRIGDQNSITIGARRCRRKGTVAKIPVGIRGQISGEAYCGASGASWNPRVPTCQRGDYLHFGLEGIPQWWHGGSIRMVFKCHQKCESRLKSGHRISLRTIIFLFVSATSINASLIINVWSGTNFMADGFTFRGCEWHYCYRSNKWRFGFARTPICSNVLSAPCNILHFPMKVKFIFRQICTEKIHIAVLFHWITLK